MARLTKQQVASLSLALAEQELPVEELGGEILIRQLTAGARTGLLEGIVDLESGAVTDLAMFQARLFSVSLVDPPFDVDEARVFLDTWPASIWDKIMAAINALTPNPQEVERAAAQEFRGADNRPAVPVSNGRAALDDGGGAAGPDDGSGAERVEGAGVSRER
jgi:hypothetical protein